MIVREVSDGKDKLIIDTDNIETTPKVSKSGYHISTILKGTLGEISKIQEEVDELKDAELQGIKLMIYVELSDIYGALESYAEKHGITMHDLKMFSDLNKRVKSGND